MINNRFNVVYHLLGSVKLLFYKLKIKNMNYEETIINKVMKSDVVFIDDKTIVDRYKKPEIEDWRTALDNADDKYNIVYWDEKTRVLKLKTII